MNKMNSLDQYNASWDTPGNISNNSMPAGNGDIGINVWVEEKGDFNSNDFTRQGLVLFTVRNGNLQKKDKTYCEKIMIADENAC